MTNNTNRLDHSNCDHDRTPKARAACRKARKAATLAKVEARAELVRVLGREWVIKGASRFGKVRTSDIDEACDALLAYFAPSGDEDKDDWRRRNGYTITTNAHTIRSIVLRSFS